MSIEQWAVQELKEAGIVVPQGVNLTHFLVKQAVTALKTFSAEDKDAFFSALYSTPSDFTDGKRPRDAQKEEEESVVVKCLRLMDQMDAVRKEIMELK